jgi:hypothetical protein
MSPAEVVHRSWRLARRPVERARMRAGVYARLPRHLAAWRGPDRFYFTDARAPVDAELLDRANRACSGQREVLGLGWLELGAEPWQLEPRAGREWPRIDATRVLAATPAGFDARLTWELNRGHEWVVLARAHAATGDPHYRDRLDSELASWRRANPLGIGINWASAMEAAIRIHSLAWVAGLVGGDGTLARMLYEHATFVARNLSAFSSANNHVIVELSGLAVASRVLGIASWLAPALARLEHEVGRQVFDDGVHAEMATHYHQFVLEALVLVARLERAHDAPRLSLERVIAKMADYLDAIRYADDSVLSQGDSDDGKIIPLLARPSRILAAARGGDLLTDTAPYAPTRSRAFRTSGQIVLRSARLVATFDAGPFGFGTLAAHAHCDALAVNVAIDGRPLLVDRGTYIYSGSERDLFRATAAHNTLQVADLEQATTAGPFLWSRQPRVTLERCELGGELELVQASHDGFAANVGRRTLLHRSGILAVIDELATPCRFTCRYHLAPGLTPHRHSARVYAIVRSSGHHVAWWWTDAPSVSVSEWEHSPRYCSLVPAVTLECACADRTIAVVVSPDPIDDALAASLLASASSPAPTPSSTQNKIDM